MNSDETTVTANTTSVEFYWRPGCPFCLMLRRKLMRSDLAVREVNIWDDPDAAARVRAVAGGNETVPTVFVGDHAMVNPGSREVLDAVRTHAPDALPSPSQQGRRSRWWRPWK